MSTAHLHDTLSGHETKGELDGTPSASCSKHRSERPEGTALTLSFNRTAPSSAPFGLFVYDVSEITLGRGITARAASSRKDAQSVHFEIPDRRISSVHARLTRRGPDWIFSDAGSRNGSYVNGHLANGRPLAHGDVIELGTSFLCFRQGTSPQRSEGEPFSIWSHGDTPKDLLTSVCPSVAERAAEAERILLADVPLNVWGEPGSGIESIVEHLHRTVGRTLPVTVLTCGETPGEVVVSVAPDEPRASTPDELSGFFAHGSSRTILLHELDTWSADAHLRLLRALRRAELTARREGSAVPRQLSLLTYTEQPLDACVTAGTVPKALYAALLGRDFHVPPLRERMEDIGLFVAKILQRIDPPRGGELRFTVEAARALFRYTWPCNLRELDGAVRAAAALADDGAIALQHLPSAVREAKDAPRDGASAFHSLATTLKGNVSQLARSLGTSRAHVRRLAERYGCDLESLRN